jgi:hypothetical protein
MIAIFFLSIPALAFLYVVHRIVSAQGKKQISNARNLMRYNNPEAYTKMIADEKAERRGKLQGVAVAGGIVLLVIILSQCHVPTVPASFNFRNLFPAEQR